MNEIAKRITHLLEEKNMTYEELGELMNVNKSTIQRYISGDISSPRLLKIQKLADALGTSVGYILGEEPETEHIKNEISSLEKILFQKCLETAEDYKDREQKYGFWSNIALAKHQEFCALYSVIEDSGLEVKYAQWKQEVTK